MHLGGWPARLHSLLLEHAVASEGDVLFSASHLLEILFLLPIASACASDYLLSLISKAGRHLFMGGEDFLRRERLLPVSA